MHGKGLRVVVASMAAVALMGCGARGGHATASSAPVATNRTLRATHAGFVFQAPATAPTGGGRVVLTVTYHGKKATNLPVVTTREADVAILQGGRTVYRWSAGRAFGQIAFQQVWQPGQVRRYHLSVPALRPGVYTVAFYFHGGDWMTHPVLRGTWRVA